jgi:hypothetical protein
MENHICWEQTTLFAKLSQSPPRYAGISVADGGHTVLMTDERDAGRHITLVEAEQVGK